MVGGPAPVLAQQDSESGSAAIFTALCSNGVAVPNPDTKVGLVADCAALLAARDALAGHQ